MKQKSIRSESAQWEMSAEQLSDYFLEHARAIVRAGTKIVPGAPKSRYRIYAENISIDGSPKFLHKFRVTRIEE